MDMRAINHQVKVQEWREIISECRNSGMPVRQWCTENNIRVNQYYYWLRVIRNETLALVPKESQIVETSTFATLKVSEMSNPESIDSGICAIIKTSNFSVEIKNGANSNTLGDIIQILNNLC